MLPIGTTVETELWQRLTLKSRGYKESERFIVVGTPGEIRE